MTSGSTPRSLAAGISEFPAGAELRAYESEAYEFVWVIQGRAEWVRGEQRVELGQGQLLLLRPGMRSDFVWDRNTASRHAWIEFALAGERDPIAEEAWPSTRPLSPADPMAALSAYALWLAREDHADRRDRAQEVLELLVSIFVRGPFRETRGIESLPAPLLRAARHVRERWAADGLVAVPLPELADAAHVSPGHLSRLFRAHVGTGPASALERVRLARAVTLLTRTSLSVTAIAQACGFANPYHFSRRFRATFGVPPRTYRGMASEGRFVPAVEPGLAALADLASPEIEEGVMEGLGA